MACSDLLITRAGPRILAEATALGIPCILTSCRPGEEQNAEMVPWQNFAAARGGVF